MIQLIFTVHDAKAEAYLPPFFLPTLGMATRTFSDCANDPNHQFCQHPEDYTLFQLGQFESNSATFEIMETAKPIAKAIELKTVQQKKPIPKPTKPNNIHELELDDEGYPMHLTRQSGDK